MAVKVRLRDGVTILDCSGNLRIGYDDVELRDLFKQQLEAGCTRFVFNLTRVGFMDSAALGETVACHKRAQENGAEIKIVLVPRGRPHETLQITSLDRVFDLFETEDEAMASLGVSTAS